MDFDEYLSFFNIEAQRKSGNFYENHYTKKSEQYKRIINALNEIGILKKYLNKKKFYELFMKN